MDLKTLVGTITIATTGLTSCGTGGTVDPPPSPLMCSSVGGSNLSATATVSGSKVHVTVSYEGIGYWQSAPALSNVTGGKAGAVTLSTTTGPAEFDIDLKGAPPTKGGFTLKGKVTNGQTTCSVERTFTFSVSGGAVMVAELDDALPLRAGELATIVVMNRDERAVHLHPRGAAEGSRVTWTATAGHVAVRDDGGATWTLPEERGLYQVELVVERGEMLAVDTLAIEVT